MNPFFDWLKDSGTQAVLVLLGTVAACLAASFAFYYGRKSLTKKDLTPLEQNTAASSGHLEDVRSHLQSMNQSAAHRAERNAAMEEAQSVSIKVWGEDHPAQLLRMHLAPHEPHVVLTRIGLYNEHGSCFGSIACARESDSQFGVPLTPDQFGRWMQGGTVQNANRVRARLRVYMTLNGREAYRDMSVSLFSGHLIRGNTSGPLNQVDGKV